jgi:hypothetical protein
MDTNLTEEKRKQLDGIVHQMTINGEPEHAIQFVVSDFKSKYSNESTHGVWDSIKKGFSNARQDIAESGKELSSVMDTNANPFIKTTKAATTLIKAPIKIGSELAISTPLRAAGEVIQSATDYDINEATSQGIQKLVQKGMNTETAKKVMDSYAKLKETDPESAMALSALMDIGDIGANVIGLGASKAATTAAKQGVENVVKKGTQAVGEQVAKVAPKIGNTAEKTGEYLIGKTYDFNQKTIQDIIKNPDLFTPAEMAKIDKEAIAKKVFKAINNLENKYSDTGKIYEKIRNTDVRADNAYTVIPKTEIESVLNKFGLQLDKSGKIIHDANSVPLSSGDISQLQGWLDKYAKSELHTPNTFLNARQASGKLANFAVGTTDVADKIGQELYSTLNKIGRPQIKGLAELDKKFSPLREQYKKIKKDYFDKSGNLKDNAYSKLFNLTGKNKEKILARLEKVAPGITEDLNILKSIEDITGASERRAGAYMKTGLAVGGGALAGGLPGAVIGMVLTSPKVGVALLRTYGKMKKINTTGIISKMKAGKKLIGDELKIMNEAVDNASKKIQNRAKNAKPGMTIKDVSGDNPLIQEARKVETLYKKWSNGENTKNALSNKKQAIDIVSVNPKLSKISLNKAYKQFADVINESGKKVRFKDIKPNEKFYIYRASYKDAPSLNSWTLDNHVAERFSNEYGVSVKKQLITKGDIHYYFGGTGKQGALPEYELIPKFEVKSQPLQEGGKIEKKIELVAKRIDAEDIAGIRKYIDTVFTKPADDMKAYMAELPKGLRQILKDLNIKKDAKPETIAEFLSRVLETKKIK